MQEDYQDRMAKPAQKRGRGRPKKPMLETQQVIDPNVPGAMIMVCCGRGATPRVVRLRDDGTRDCVCPLCGKLLFYDPPRMRVVGGGS